MLRAIYKMPTADTKYDDRIPEGLSRSIRLAYTYILILKDYNLPKVNFTEHTYIGRDNSTEAWFFSTIENLGLLENLELSSRRWNSQTLSRLGCVVTNEEFLNDNATILAPPGRSVRDVIVSPFKYCIICLLTVI